MRIQTSFKTFRAPINCKPQKPIIQKIKVRGNWLVRGNMQKCLECRGVPKIVLRGNGRLAGFYSVSIPYPHKENCSNK